RREADGEARHEQLAEAPSDGPRSRECVHGEQAVQRHDHERADEAPLLADDGERVAGVRRWDEAGVGIAGTCSEGTSEDEPAEGLEGLVAGPTRVIPWVNPHIDALFDACRDGVDQEKAHHGDQESNHDITTTPSCEVEEPDEARAEDQRGTKVAL